MARDGEEESLGGESSGTTTTRLRVRTDPFLVVCRCFSVITALVAILCIVVNILSAIRSFENGSDIFDGIFRCYAVGIAFFVVLAETEWGFILKFWKVLEYWIGRGMLQILDSCALDISNVLDSRKRFQGTKQSRIWKNWSGEERNLNNCLLRKGSETVCMSSPKSQASDAREPGLRVCDTCPLSFL